MMMTKKKSRMAFVNLVLRKSSLVIINLVRVIMDEQRIIEWWNSSPRKSANLAFTEGDERTAAYFMEIAAAEKAAEIRELKNALYLCASMAGNPDAAEGCRKIIAFVKKYVGDSVDVR